MTMAPASRAIGAYSFEAAPDAEMKTKSAPLNDVVRRRLDGDLALAEGDALAGGALRREELQRLQREAALGGDLEELSPDDAGGADDGDVVLLGRHGTYAPFDETRSSGAF